MTNCTLGPLLKEIRLSRKMTLKRLADDIISVAQLSKFENGKSNLTVDRLLLLLDKLNVTYEEYFTEANAFKRPEIEKLSTTIAKCYMKQDVETLKEIYKEQQDTYSETKTFIHKLNGILVASVLDEMTEANYVTDDMRNELAEYLFEVEKWRYYEVVLFGNSMRTLTIDMLKMVTRELMKSPVLSVQVRKNKQLRIQILYNVALTMIKEEELEFAKELIEETWRSVQKDETLILERIKLHYLRGYHMYKSGEYETGKKLMNETLDTLKLYECKHLANNFQSHYEANVE